MFTTLGFFGGALLAWMSGRHQNSDADDTSVNIKHTRQDIRLVAYILFGILVMLGVIADRVGH